MLFVMINFGRYLYFQLCIEFWSDRGGVLMRIFGFFYFSEKMQIEYKFIYLYMYVY